MTLGYIVTSRKIRGVSGFVEQVESIDKVDSTKPTLIIGWENAKKYDGYTNILDRQLSENVFWTFSRSESRSELESDLKEFNGYIINRILNNIKYHYVNIFKLKYGKIKKLLHILLYSNDVRNIYISNGFIYIPYENDILGLSLKMLSYCGVGEERVINKIKENPNNKLIYDSNPKVVKIARELGDKKYAVPYFID